MNKTISEMKKTVEGIKSRLDEAKDLITDLKYKVEKTSPKEQEKVKRLKRMKRC